jgi:hypothetical protein
VLARVGANLKRPSKARIALVVAITLIVLSLFLAVVSLFPAATGQTQTTTLIDNTFRLTPNETRRQGLGSFHGGENLTLQIQCQDNFCKNFSIVAYSGLRYSNYSNLDFTYNFTVGADYYEAIFTTNGTNQGTAHFQVNSTAPQTLFPYSWLTAPAKVLFLVSLGSAGIVLLIPIIQKQTVPIAPKLSLPKLDRRNRRLILILLIISLIFWLVLVMLNANPLATFENWYTDHVRHSYTSSLFMKDGLSVFNTPLDTLASQDSSPFKYVTWPEMPHLYPIGSLLLFMPFGAMLQGGLDPVLVYKLEMTLFLVVAHICLYFFLTVFLKKPMHLSLKLVGVYIIYLALPIYAANGMFDSVAFLFSLFAVTAFLTERYDYFFLLMAASVILKYQAGIFLLPLIVVGIIKLLQNTKLPGLIRNKAVVLGTFLLLISAFTAYESFPYLMQTRPELVMNGINAFSSNAQIPWSLQSSSILVTLLVTLIYAAFMLKQKNALMAVSSMFMLVPSLMLPYFQNWYIPFIFVYALVPQNKREVEATILWLIFMVGVLSFGMLSFNPLTIISNFRTAVGI